MRTRNSPSGGQAWPARRSWACQARLDRAAGILEGAEERVALAADDRAAALDARRVDDLVVGAEQLRDRRAQAPQQRGRALDVGEHEGDDAVGSASGGRAAADPVPPLSWFDAWHA